MSLESRKHMLETPRSPAAKAAVTTVAEVSSTNGVFAQMFTPPPPPPPIFVSRPQQARSTSSQLPSTPPRRRTRADLTRPAYPVRNPQACHAWGV